MSGGVGKTTTCQILKNKLPNCVFLDGDWCWDMHPFQVTPETKKMVMENICFLLNQFIRCIAYENIIFCWVMHEQAIIDEILLKLETENCLIHTISLICDADGLRKRLQKIVIEKRFLPGEKFPNEIELSGELEISRTTLREAFRILAANGVVKIRRGLGTFVREDFEIDKGKVWIRFGL